VWLEATLTTEDIHEILGQFSPLEIQLGENGRLSLARPTKVSVVQGKGIGVVCDATLHWPVLGVNVPVTMHGLTMLIHPGIEKNSEGEVLVFTLQIDHAGVSALHFIDDRVTAHLNEELVKKHVGLSWNFGKTLTHVFRLPEALLSTEALGLKVTCGTVKITEGALRFAVDFAAEVKRRIAGTNSP
jgi:hypothetical protein